MVFPLHGVGPGDDGTVKILLRTSLGGERHVEESETTLNPKELEYILRWVYVETSFEGLGPKDTLTGGRIRGTR